MTNKPDLLDQMRDGFAWVTAQSTRVQIDMDALTRVAADLPRLWTELQDRFFDEGHHFYGREDWGNVREQFLNYILCLNAANFGSGWKADLAPTGFHKPEDGFYFTFAGRLKDHFERNHGVWSADTLADLEKTEVARVFKFNLDNADQATLCGQFHASLNALGTAVRNDYGGKFANVVEAAAGQSGKFVEQLAAMSSFYDASDYNGRTIPFMKRAQLTASDIAWREPQAFQDLDRLTVMLDDMVPHTLRLLGILHYADDLAAKIDAGICLPANGEEEVELRAVAGHAVTLLSELSGLSARDIDPILWHLGHDGDCKNDAHRPHRTKTLAY
jgi:hypothetical protein